MTNIPKKTIRATERGIEIFYDNKRHVTRLEYEEKGLADLQLYGNKLNGKMYQAQTAIHFNSIQQSMYRRLIYGIESIPYPELKKMKKLDKKIVQKRHKKAQQVINIWKNEILSSFVNGLFTEFFWNSDITKEMKELSKDPEFMKEENTLSFKDLGITKKHVANKLIEHGLLPVNFFHLSA